MTFDCLHIGLVGPLPPPFGGMANQTRQLAKLLRDEGSVVEVLDVNHPYWPRWISKLPRVRAIFRLVPYLTALWRLAGRASLFHVMANSGWSWHLFAAPAIWIGKLRGVPVVVNYRGGAAESFFARSFFWVKWSLRKADVIVVPSCFLQEVFAKRGMRARVVPNIVDISRFSALGEAKRIMSNGPPHIIITRNLEPIYDVGNALRAFAMFRQRFPEATMVIAGSGPERMNLEALATALGVRHAVTFAGQLDNAEIATLYGRATMMVNPSLVDNMPISILEALACGVPVVSTNVGGVPYLVHDGETALLVPPRSPDEMAKAMCRVAGDKALALRLIEAGNVLVQDYTWRNVGPKLFAVYASVLGTQRPEAMDLQW